MGGLACQLHTSFWKLRKIDWREPREGSFDILGSCIWAISLTVLLGFSYLPDWVRRCSSVPDWRGSSCSSGGKREQPTRYPTSISCAETGSSHSPGLVHQLQRHVRDDVPRVSIFSTTAVSTPRRRNRLVAGMFVQAAFHTGRPYGDRIQARLVASTGMASRGWTPDVRLLRRRNPIYGTSSRPCA